MVRQNIYHFVEETIVGIVFRHLAAGLTLIVIITAVLGYAHIASTIRHQTLSQLQHETHQHQLLLDRYFTDLNHQFALLQQQIQTTTLQSDVCPNEPTQIQKAVQVLNQATQLESLASVRFTLEQPEQQQQIHLDCTRQSFTQTLPATNRWGQNIDFKNNQAWITVAQPIDDNIFIVASIDIQATLTQLQNLTWVGASSFLYNQEQQALTEDAPQFEFNTSLPFWHMESQRYIAVKQLETTGWYLAVTLPKTILGHITWQIAQLILLFGGIILLSVFVLLHTFLFRLVANPLHEIILATKQLGKKDFNVRLKMQRQDEFGVLAKSFDKMVQHLANHQQQLQTYAMRLENEAQQLTQLNQQLKREMLERQKAQTEKEQLLIENMQMSAELDIARRLQQLILPKSTEIKTIPQLEIATLMEAAAEVGGDYYDVLQHQGMIKIGIGDVTGHGLESGILSLMVQTAVRTLLISEQHDPIQFLSILNKTVFANIQRMGIDKELTLLMLDYHCNTLRISGQHEQVIVVRQGQLELLDTDELGFPIGLEEDIEHFVSFKEVDLNEGDVVILYTDGITEAENKHGEYYGLERMCSIISKYWCKTSVDICQAIVNDVESFIDGYEILDDITLIVMKQKPELAIESY
ncbi:SpoIIE family protein phosphatase [Candidatus Albibeggiatoa sp. nov. NOAA]|uniref:SpoIIE family protein phosphatase n=1 Tax=Candidatus Albibeggiatoa sp. nov. NOAA TaxID=3162724 RepID=UPI003304DC3D|nr:SpoIIE family protein phosphatase [Thiotrichaceae bacterium]